MKNEFTKELERIGLSEKEAFVYEYLLREGKTKVSDLIMNTPYKRGDLYNILYSLVEKTLIEQITDAKVVRFQAQDPYKLKDQIDKQRASVEENNAALKAVLPQMLSVFHLTQEKPSVRVYEGVEGLLKVYDELNDSREKELLLFRSVNDSDSAELQKLIENQIKKQIRLKIVTRALTPLEEGTRETFLRYDQANMVERRILQKNELALPAQFLIWGNTLAIISLKKQIISTVIENKDIAMSMRTLFEYIWNKSKSDHERIIATWSDSEHREMS